MEWDFSNWLVWCHLSLQEDLKTTQSARDREAKQMAQLERTRQRNPSDRQIDHRAALSDKKRTHFRRTHTQSYFNISKSFRTATGRNWLMNLTFLSAKHAPWDRSYLILRHIYSLTNTYINNYSSFDSIKMLYRSICGDFQSVWFSY